MPITLRSVVDRRELGLRTVWADDAAADRVWSWIHSSDLVDPTPFLSPGDALLTTGVQWRDDDDIAPWVARLARGGVPAVGFGTEVFRDGTPDALVTACAEHGIALFEVPYRTPFIAVGRAVADIEAGERFARVRFTLDAQRAIALAALRPDGLTAALAELERRVDGPVALIGSDGHVAVGHAPGQVALDTARRMLADGRRAAVVIEGVTLQTIGRPEALRGVLAVGGATAHDDAARAVITSVIAMVGLALEQERTLARTLDDLRAELLAALLRGERDLVATTLRALGGRLPEEPLAVAVIDPAPGRREALLDLLAGRARAGTGARRAPALFHARDGARVVILLDADRVDGVLPELVQQSRGSAGLVRTARWERLEAAVDEAARAADRMAERSTGAHGHDVTDLEDARTRILDAAALRDDGMLTRLAGDDARRVAEAMLAPLDDHDAQANDALVATLVAWLGADAVAEQAATALGVHRHTVRARVRRAEQLLGRDLGAFPARAELWAALVAAGRA